MVSAADILLKEQRDANSCDGVKTEDMKLGHTCASPSLIYGVVVLAVDNPDIAKVFWRLGILDVAHHPNLCQVRGAPVDAKKEYTKRQARGVWPHAQVILAVHWRRTDHRERRRLAGDASESSLQTPDAQSSYIRSP